MKLTMKPPVEFPGAIQPESAPANGGWPAPPSVIGWVNWAPIALEEEAAWMSACSRPTWSWTWTSWFRSLMLICWGRVVVR